MSNMRKKAVETCEMCSAEMPKPITIKVEGALLRVCPKCTTFGNVVKEREKPRPILSNKRPNVIKKRVFRKQKPVSELIDDYDIVIRRARQKKKLSHEQLASQAGISVAAIKSIESGKMRPTDRDAKKLARELNVELFATLEAELEFADRKKKKATTLGDIAVIRKFDYDRD